MKKALLWILVGAFAGYVIFFVVPNYLHQPLEPRSQARLSQVAAEINRSVGVMIDRETELLPAEGHEGMLIYKYRLVSFEVAKIDHAKFAAGAKPRLTQRACSEPDMRDDYLKQGVTLRYSYFDKDKQHIATVDVTPADCGF